jgi:hypothetical protein
MGVIATIVVLKKQPANKKQAQRSKLQQHGGAA